MVQHGGVVSLSVSYIEDNIQVNFDSSFINSVPSSYSQQA